MHIVTFEGKLAIVFAYYGRLFVVVNGERIRVKVRGDGKEAVRV